MFEEAEHNEALRDQGEASPHEMSRPFLVGCLPQQKSQTDWKVTRSNPKIIEKLPANYQHDIK